MTEEIEIDEAQPFIERGLSDPAEQVRNRAQTIVEMLEEDAATADVSIE